MPTGRRLPTDALAFIQRCVRERKVYWTYHVNMRLADRYISRDELFAATESYEIIELYPGDKYLPSYLVWALVGGRCIPRALRRRRRRGQRANRDGVPAEP